MQSESAQTLSPPSTLVILRESRLSIIQGSRLCQLCGFLTQYYSLHKHACTCTCTCTWLESLRTNFPSRSLWSREAAGKSLSFCRYPWIDFSPGVWHTKAVRQNYSLGHSDLASFPGPQYLHNGYTDCLILELSAKTLLDFEALRRNEAHT